jgi:hypothetical protein
MRGTTSSGEPKNQRGSGKNRPCLSSRRRRERVWAIPAAERQFFERSGRSLELFASFLFQDKKEVGVAGAEAPDKTKTHIQLKIRLLIFENALQEGLVELAKVELKYLCNDFFYFFYQQYFTRLFSLNR